MKIEGVMGFWQQADEDRWSEFTSDEIKELISIFYLETEVSNAHGCKGYCVSSCGRVFTKVPLSRKPDEKYREISLSKSSNGYLRFTIRIGCKCVTKHIHAVMADSFLGLPSDGQTLVRHLDGDKTNNNLSNLMRGSRRDNAQDSISHGTICRGESSNFSVLAEQQVLDIVSMRKSGCTYKMIGEKFGVSSTCVLHIINGTNWRSVTGIVEQVRRKSRGRKGVG